MGMFHIENQLSKSIQDVASGNFIKGVLAEKSTVGMSGIITHSFTCEVQLPQVDEAITLAVFFRIEGNTVENNAVISFERETLFYPYVAYTSSLESVTVMSFIDLFGCESGLDLKQIRNAFESLLPYGELLQKVAEKYEAEIIVAEDALEFGRDYKMLAS